jgi:C-terminal processing protease CtpA/Prc
MKLKSKLLLLLITIGLFTSCFEDEDDNFTPSANVNDFVWKALNIVYLYKDQVPDLADEVASDSESYNTFINGFETPQALFNHLLYEPETIDRFSFLSDNYIELEQLLQGTSVSNGLRMFAFENPENTSELILVVNTVIKGSPAESAGIARGDFITRIDNTVITSSNVSSLLAPDSFTLEFANHDDNGTTDDVTDDTFTANGTSIALTKTAFTENPINTTAIIDAAGENVGYLMYRGFRANFVNELNTAFSEFAANNVQHLVLDLRYNGGGNVSVANLLGSLITGQYTGDTFVKLFYNDRLQNNNFTYEFVSTGASLNLDKVYVLTTEQTASASELIINSLKPYIEVVQIGTRTIGKTQFSSTVYDAPQPFSKNGINPNHTYAMQPLVGNSSNVNDQLVPLTGLVPDIILEEDVLNLGTFGAVNEPLLERALEEIAGTRAHIAPYPLVPIQIKLGALPFENEMYIQPLNIQR